MFVTSAEKNHSRGKKNLTLKMFFTFSLKNHVIKIFGQFCKIKFKEKHTEGFIKLSLKAVLLELSKFLYVLYVEINLVTLKKILLGSTSSGFSSLSVGLSGLSTQHPSPPREPHLNKTLESLSVTITCSKTYIFVLTVSQNVKLNRFDTRILFIDK